MQKITTADKQRLKYLIKKVRAANQKAYELARQLEEMEEAIWGASHNSLDADEIIEDIDYSFRSDKPPMGISEYIEIMNKSIGK